ncbi:MAG: hypothetical protein WCO23_00145, partial [bacterium]
SVIIGLDPIIYGIDNPFLFVILNLPCHFRSLGEGWVQDLVAILFKIGFLDTLALVMGFRVSSLQPGMTPFTLNSKKQIRNRKQIQSF